MSILKTIYLQHLNGANANMTLDSSGRVGIGNNSPSFPLHVGGEIFSGRSDSSLEGGQISLGRASDDFAHYNIDCYGSSTTPSLRFIDAAAGAARMSIDSSGRITMPYQPMCWVGHNSTVSYSVNQLIQLTAIYDPLSMFSGASNYRITVPVAGRYLVYADLLVNSGSADAMGVVLRKNGSSVRRLYSHNGAGYQSGSLGVIVNCAANDYIDLKNNDSACTIWGGDIGNLTVILIG